jgi:hypothetical protein
VAGSVLSGKRVVEVSDGTMSVVRSEDGRADHLPEVWKGALDEPPVCSDCSLLLARARQSDLLELRVASDVLVAAAVTPMAGGQGVTGLVPSPTQGLAPAVGGVVGREWRDWSRYLCRGDTNGVYCGLGRSGIAVHIGMVACRYSEEGRCFRVDGDEKDWCCEDTGGPAVEDGTLDFWAEDADQARQVLPQGEGGWITWLP